MVAGVDFKQCNRDIDLEKLNLPSENTVSSIHRVGRFMDKEIVSCEFVVVELDSLDTSTDYTDLAKAYFFS